MPCGGFDWWLSDKDRVMVRNAGSRVESAHHGSHIGARRAPREPGQNRDLKCGLGNKTKLSINITVATPLHF